MKFSNHALKVGVFLSLLAAVEVFANQQSRLVLKNGSPTALSPGVLYVTSTHQPLAEAGSRPTEGFVRLCQAGETATRASEINVHPRKVRFLATTPAIMPGQSFEFALPMELSKDQAIHYESMYSKTKDVCAVVTVTGDQFLQVSPGSEKDFHSEEKVLSSGAFKDPMVSSSSRCEMAATAIDCLRTLTASEPAPKIRNFPGYLPSVLNLLEEKYGSQQAQGIVLPTQGGLNFILHR